MAPVAEFPEGFELPSLAAITDHPVDHMVTFEVSGEGAEQIMERAKEVADRFFGEGQNYGLVVKSTAETWEFGSDKPISWTAQVEGIKLG